MKRIIWGIVMALCVVIGFVTYAEEENVFYAFQGSTCFYTQDGFYGIADKDSTLLTDAKYSEVQYFDEFQQATVKINNQYARINRDGKLVFPPCKGQKFEVLHDNQGNSLLSVTNDGNNRKTVQLYNTECKQIGETYEDADMFVAGTILVQKDGKWNILCLNGEYIGEKWWDAFYEEGYDGEIVMCDDDPPINLYYTKDREAWLFVSLDDDGKVKWNSYQDGNKYEQPNNSLMPYYLNRDLLFYEKKIEKDVTSAANYLNYVTDRKLQTVVPYEFQNIPTIIDIQRGVVLGIIKENNIKTMILFDKIGNEFYHGSDYERILSFDSEKGFLCIQRENENIILNSMGATVATFDSKYYIQRYRGNDIWQFTNSKDHSWGFMDSDGNILCELPNSYYDNLTYVDDHNTGTYANGWMTSTWKQDGGRLFGTNTYGYVGIHGDLLYDVDWTGIYDFTANGRARVRTDNGYGFIDETGAYVVEPKYTTCEDYFQTGDQWLAYVADSTGWGYINNDGELICWNRKRTSVKGTTDISLRNANGGVLLSIPEGKEFILHGYDSKLGMFSATYGETEGYVKGTGLMIFRNDNWQAITKDELVEQSK